MTIGRAQFTHRQYEKEELEGSRVEKRAFTLRRSLTREPLRAAQCEMVRSCSLFALRC